MISKHISNDIPPKMNFLYGYPHSDAFLQPHLQLECRKLNKAARHPTTSDIINDTKLFPTVYRRIYCCKFLTLSYQMLCYKSKCIRMHDKIIDTT